MGPSTKGRRAARVRAPLASLRARAAFVRTRPIAALAALAPLAPLLAGCMTANGYTTPRAVEPGKVNVTLAPEMAYVGRERPGEAGLPTREESRFSYATVPPAVAVRIGVARDVDVGLNVRSAFVPGVDLKYNFYQGETFDLAVRPGVQGFGTDNDGARSWYHADLPILVGARVGERVTIVASPGIAYAKANRITSLGYPSTGAAGRLGLGVQIGLGKRFALFPEVTMVQSLGSERTLWLSGGLGIVFGPRPGVGAP
ncbi:MAG TPA: hypothetical protein VFS43_14620 [Polyangiaceae bacterium]|nr:hypothetical protein [Polyangiaceae bacterium]